MIKDKWPPETNEADEKAFKSEIFAICKERVEKGEDSSLQAVLMEYHSKKANNQSELD